MPRSPEAVEPDQDQDVPEYIAGWQAVIDLLKAGRSWSGHERNCAFLNCGGPRFANISAATGLDFADDARGLATVDWDHDGDLDLWITNRTGPRLRLMRNETSTNDQPAAHNFVIFKLRGTNCNRDAIGARVEVVLKNSKTDDRGPKTEDRWEQRVHSRGNNTTDTNSPASNIPHPASRDPQPASRSSLIKTLHAGDGFLSQSSRWLHFGLGNETEIEHVTVRWPGGETETFTGILPGRRYQLVEASGKAVEDAPRRTLKLSPSTQPAAPTTDAARIYLSVRYPRPVLRYAKFDSYVEHIVQPQSKPLLLNLWASWCTPCVAELQEWTHHQKQVRAAGLDILALSVDGLVDNENTLAVDAERLIKSMDFPFDMGVATSELLEKIDFVQDLIVYRRPRLAVPTSLLIDAQGQLAAIYRGRVDMDELFRDVASLDALSKTVHEPALPFSGRWQMASRTLDLELLVRQFRDRYPEDSMRFLELARQQRVQLGTEGRADNKEEDAQTHVQLGKAYAKQGNGELAAAQFEEALRLKPDFGEAHEALGMLLRAQGKTEKALVHFRQAAKILANSFEAHLNLGTTLRAAGQAEEALSALERAVEIRPDSATARLHLANTLRMAVRLDDAINELQQAVDIDPNHFAALGELGAYLQDKGDHRGAIGHLQRATELNPDNAPMHFHLAFSLQALGKPEEAIDHLRVAKRLAPDNGSVCYHLGMLLAQGGSIDEALENFRDAIRLQPDWLPPLLVTTGLLATHPDPRIRDGEEAVRLGERAVELTSYRNAEALDWLAAAYAAVSRFDDAVKTAEQAVQLAAAQGNERLAQKVRTRLELYRQQKPFLDPKLKSQKSP